MTLCYVTDRKAFGSFDPAGSVVAKVRAAAAAGVDWIQIREKDLPGRELFALVRAAIQAAEVPAGNIRIFVNDRLDVALAAGAGGVHLGGQSLPVGDVVRWCSERNAPAGFQVGASCHSLDEAVEAEHEGGHYIFFGPVFATPSKEQYGKHQGIAKLAEVCLAVRIPVIAIGGVNAENAGECIRAGAAGIAAIRMFQETREANALRATVARLHNLSSP